MKRSTPINSAALAFATNSYNNNNNNNYSSKGINSNIDGGSNAPNSNFTSFFKHSPSIYEPIDNDVPPTSSTQFLIQPAAFNYDYYQSQTSVDIEEAKFFECLQKQEQNPLPYLLGEGEGNSTQQQALNADQSRSMRALSSDFEEIWKHQQKSVSGQAKKYV